MNPADVFSTQEISDFNKRTILLNNVDGEVRTHKPHLVTEAQRNTLDRVLSMTTGRVHSSQLVSIFPPFVNPEPLLFLFKVTEFYTYATEVPSQGATGALHNNCGPFRTMSAFSGLSIV